MNAKRIYLQIINSWGINKIKQNGTDQYCKIRTFTRSGLHNEKFWEIFVLYFEHLIR